MSKKTHADILYLNRDLRNNIAAAITHTELLTNEEPKLKSNFNISAIVKALKEAISISKELSLGVMNIMKIAKENNFHVNYTSEPGKGTTYRAVCSWVND